MGSLRFSSSSARFAHRRGGSLCPPRTRPRPLLGHRGRWRRAEHWSSRTPTSGDVVDPSPGAAEASAAVRRVGDAAAPGERYHVEPRRVDEGPQLDGVLDEEVWATAVVIDEFVQQEPSEGDPATESTVVRMLYDARALYIGVEAFDSEPDGVIATEMRRDSPRLLDEDNFQIILDTFHDSRSGYMFVTNPLGAKLEQQVAEEGESVWQNSGANINVNWDGVWHVAARRTDDGWAAEIAIPMVTLRFPDAERQIWGINFMRNIRRKNEQVFWTPIPKAYSLTRVSLAGTLTGLGSATRGMDLRITPYVLAGGRQDRVGSSLDCSGFSDVGLDVKYGLTSGLSLDLTVNTDFAQVEVDEQQVNLTRFPLFFPEKRDFFLENSSLFSVRTQGFFDRLADLFFTRRIGLSDSGQPGQNFFVGRYSRDVLARSKVGGAHHQQGSGWRLPVQPYVRCRHDARAASQLHRHVVLGEDSDARDLDRRHGRPRARVLAQSVVAVLRQVHGPARQFECRGRLRAAGRHPDDEAAWRVGPTPGGSGTSDTWTRC